MFRAPHTALMAAVHSERKKTLAMYLSLTKNHGKFRGSIICSSLQGFITSPAISRELENKDTGMVFSITIASIVLLFIYHTPSFVLEKSPFMMSTLSFKISTW